MLKRLNARWAPLLTVAGGVLLGCAGGLSAFERQSNSESGAPHVGALPLALVECVPSDDAPAGEASPAGATDATLRTICVIDYPRTLPDTPLPGGARSHGGSGHRSNPVHAF